MENDQRPVTVVFPGPAEAAPAPRGRGAALRWIAIGLLCVMILTLLAVIVVLPDLVADRTTQDAAPPGSAPPAAAPPAAPTPDAKRLARDKREAERLLGMALRTQTELESQGVAVWGGQDYDAVMDSLAAGDAEMQAQRYAQAGRQYEDVIAKLEALRASMAARMVAAIESGEAALGSEDGPSARASFEVALAIAPHDARAQQGMQRARVVEEVVALVAAGRAHEASDELDAAQENYAAALALDALAPTARAAHADVSARIRARDFRNAMSVALAAIDDGDFAASRAALERADTLEPGSPEVADARRRLALGVQRSRIESHRAKAQAFERDERWREASAHYADVLVIDSNAAFARTGRDKSLARARINDELDGFLAEPQRLRDAVPRDNARRVLAAAGEVDGESEPKLAAKLARLARAVEIAETPIGVRLQSDNLTDVTVYRVGSLGRFASRDLLLPPGTYVAVGTRDGYRDVRVEFTVNVGEASIDVSVRCQEKI